MLGRNIALQIWKYPTSNYQSQKDNTKKYYLDDEDTNFTGKEIESFMFKNEKEEKATSWKEFYEKILLLLYDIDPVKFDNLKNDLYLKNHFFDNEKQLKNLIKIADNLFIKANTNTESKLSTLRIFLKKFNFELNQIIFYIK